jgi:hypothetical protein
MWSSVITSEIMVARHHHQSSYKIYESIRMMYPTPEDMDKDKEIFLETFHKSFGDDIYHRMQCHKTKNMNKNKHQIIKRNKKMTKDQVKEAIFNEELFKVFSRMAIVKYKHLRHYAYHFYKMKDDEFANEFLVDFLPDFLALV